MPRSLAIPDEVQHAIRARLTEALTQAAGAFESAAEDEDTLTGDLCGALRTSATKRSARSHDCSRVKLHEKCSNASRRAFVWTTRILRSRNESRDLRRYSSDNQRDASIADQFRICREFARRQGWQIANEYSDHAVSGATLLRSGFQAMMQSALRKDVDIVLAESLDDSAVTRRTQPASSSGSPSPASASSHSRKATSHSSTSA